MVSYPAARRAAGGRRKVITRRSSVLKCLSKPGSHPDFEWNINGFIRDGNAIYVEGQYK